MIFSWLQSLFPRRRRSDAIVRKRKLKSAALVAERLEARTLLTPFYDLTVVARTGSQFVAFGDLVSINNVAAIDAESRILTGTVAFVGITDADNDGTPESGLWTYNSRNELTNINPEYSNTNGRDFGRAVSINDEGDLVARDRYVGGQVQFFVRAWSSESPDVHANIASAGGVKEQQPDFGKYSILQTFTDINDNSDIVFVAQTADGKQRQLILKRHNVSEPVMLLKFANTETVPRPQLTGSGQVLYRASKSELVLFDPFTKAKVNVAAGFTNIGYASGISDDGRLVSFVGDKGEGLGVYLAYRTSGGVFKTVRVAGAGQDGWSGFDLTDAVRVNSTLLNERGATVAFEATHFTLGTGIYTTRVSFLDDDPVDWDADYALPYVNGAVPVVTVGDTVGGQTVTDVEFWNGLNDRNRGELAFWVEAGGGQMIVRAEPFQVAYLDFTPSDAPPLTSTVTNLKLLQQFGVSENMGWDADFSAAMQSAGLPALAAASAQTDIVNRIQSYFQLADARVKVVGRAGESNPEFVPYTVTPTPASGAASRGVYQTIYVGAKSGAEANGFLGLASPTYAGQGGLDYFNQITDDSAVVLADQIFRPGVVFTNPQDVPYSKAVQGISAIIAHEIGHNFGLYHLEDDLSSTLGQIMRSRAPADTDLTHGAAFSNASFPREAYTDEDDNEVTPGNENSIARLYASVGNLRNLLPGPRYAEDEVLEASGNSQRAYLPYSATGQGPTVARMLLGTIQSDHGEFLPSFQDLGQGSIADVLAAAKLSTRPGTQFILLGSTDGTRLDIVGLPNGSAFDPADIDPTFLGISTNVGIQLSFDPDSGSNGFQLFHVPESGAAVLMGTAAVQSVAEVQLVVNGATLDRGTAYGLGETTPGGGALTRVITIRNSGSGTLELGTVSIAGSGYSVTQPGQATLLPGQETTVTVTLSDATAGIGLEGQLTIPSNDPSGAFQLTLRGTVDSRPRVTGITRIDNGTGPIRIQIDFSGQLQTTPAGNADYYTVSSVNGQVLPVVSAVYTQVGAVSRVVLTTSVNASALPSGNYDVRIDGTQVRAVNGAPLATSGHNVLAEQAWNGTAEGATENNETWFFPTIIVVGANGSGQAGVLSGPESTGVAPPEVINLVDLNGDDVPDYVATSRFTGQLVFHWGQADGGYETEVFDLDRPLPGLIANPTSLATADWNNDGYTDLVVFDAANDYFLGVHYRILIYLNDGQGNFTTAPDTPIPVANDVYGLILGVGDFTGDGLPDVALAGPEVDDGGSVAIYGKDPFLGYGQAAVYPTGHSDWFPESAVMADLNGDGRLDLVVSNTGFYLAEPRPVVYLNTPTGLVLQEDLEYDGEAGRVGVGDVTGDGKPDIVIVNDYYSNLAGVQDGGVISVLRGNGSGQFTALPNILLNRRGTSLAAIGDVNGDGKVDLVLQADQFQQVGFDTTPELSLWTVLGDGTGGFDITSPLVPFAPTNNVTPGNYILQDMTGDGAPDLTFGNTGSGQIGLFINNGAGQFVASSNGVLTATVTAWNTQFRDEQGVFIGDLNRDGFPDQLRVVGGAGIFQTPVIDVLWGNADGEFHIVSNITIPPHAEYSPQGASIGSIGFMRVGDVNNDGWLDILVGDDNGTGSPLAIYLGVDGKNFEKAPQFMQDGGSGVTTYMGELADVNGDGNLDYVALVNVNGSLGYGVFFGDGTSKLTYNANAFMAIPGLDYASPTLADFNGDGKLDLAVAVDGSYAPSQMNQLLIYNGLGNGKFTLGQTVNRRDEDGGYRLFTNDFDGDGNLDIITAGRKDGSLNFFLGTGTGQFTEALDLMIPVGYQVGRLVAGDFTGDGVDDLAVTRSTGWIYELLTTIAIYPGQGGGQFGDPQLIETGGIRAQTLALIPTAGTINAGSFTISQPVLSVPTGVGNLNLTTLFEAAVAVNPRPMIDPYASDPYVISVDTDPAHGTVIVLNNGTPANLTDDTLMYLPAQGYAGADSFTYTATDGRGGTATRTVTITVVAQNQSPVIGLSPGTATILSHNYFQAVDPNVTVTDIDSLNFMGGKLTVDLTIGIDGQDALSLETSSPGPGTVEVDWDEVYYEGQLIGKLSGGYNEPITLTFTTTAATPAAVQAVLSRVAYYYYEEFSTPLQRQLTITLTDGDGGSTTVTKSMTVPVRENNVAPSIDLSDADTFYSAGGPPVAVDSSATVIDPDSVHLANWYLTADYTFTEGDLVTIKSVGTGPGQINVAGTKVRYGSVIFGEIVELFNTDLGVTFNSNATPAIVQALLRQLTFSTTSTENYDRSIQLSLNDGSGDGTTYVWKTITFGSPVEAPVIDLSSGATSYPSDQSAVVIDAGATVSDGDSTNFDDGVLTISLQSGGSIDDRLGIKHQGSGAGQINLAGNVIRYGSNAIGSYSGGFSDNSDLVISLLSNANTASVTALLRSLTFAIADSSPSTTSRTIRFVLEDGDGGTSEAVDKTVTVSAPPAGNPAPTLQLPSSNPTYSKAAQPVAVDAGAVVFNPTSGSGTLGGGVLIVSINDVNTGRKKLDLFSLSSLSGIGVSRGTQLVNGRLVTIYDLNSNVTAQTVQNAIRGINFKTSGKGLKTTTRNVKIQLEDSDGDKSAEVTKTINVSKKKVKVPRSRSRNRVELADGTGA